MSDAHTSGVGDLPDRRLFWRWVWSAVRPVLGWVLARVFPAANSHVHESAQHIGLGVDHFVRGEEPVARQGESVVGEDDRAHRFDLVQPRELLGDGGDVYLAAPGEEGLQSRGGVSEQGRSMGSDVIVATRSGTNEYHGNLWEFLRNAKLDARNFFDPVRPSFKR